MGTVLVARLAARAAGACSHDDISLESNQFGRESGEALELPLGITYFNCNVAALDVTEVSQSLEERLIQMGSSGQVGRQMTYPGDLGRLLRHGGERRGEEAACQSADERSSVHHSIT